MNRYFLTAILISLLAAAGFAQTRVDTIRHRLLDRYDHSVIVAAHRGDWRNFPENSLQAITSAAEMGVDIVEIDLQRTKDGELVLMHDPTLDRTSTGTGAIADTTLAYIRTLKLRHGDHVRSSHPVPTLEEALLAAKGKVMLNLDKADRYFDQVFELLEKTGTTDHIVMKGSQKPEKVRTKFGQYLNRVIYMPIVNLDKPNAEENIERFVSDMNPVAFELLFIEDSNPLPLKLKDSLKGRTRIWYNTLWDTMAGGHDDDASMVDIDNGWGYLIDKLDCSVIQTDRPQMLLDYLRGRGLHD